MGRNRKFEDAEVKRMLRGADFRCLSDPLARAVKLVGLGIPYEVAARVTGVSKSRLQRAVQAAKAGREIGRVGRPTLLDPAQEAVIVDRIKRKHSEVDVLSLKEIGMIVISPPYRGY